MVLLFLESLGTTELLVIVIVALVLFGPRRLPELSRSLGKSLNEFKRASDDFKRTWEREVALESVERDAAIERAMPHEEQIAPTQATPAANAATIGGADAQGFPVARGSQQVAAPTPTVADVDAETTAENPSRKSDWL